MEEGPHEIEASLIPDSSIEILFEEEGEQDIMRRQILAGLGVTEEDEFTRDLTPELSPQEGYRALLHLESPEAAAEYAIRELGATAEQAERVLETLRRHRDIRTALLVAEETSED